MRRLLGLAFAPFALAQYEQASPWAALRESGFIASLQEALEPQTVDGFDAAKDYDVEFLSADGSVTPFRARLAQDEERAHAPLLSVGYYGPVEGSGGQVYSHLFAFLAGLCLGVDEVVVNDLNAAIGAFFPKLGEDWQNESVNFGELTVGGETEGEDVNMLIDLENIGMPGENGWFITCGLE